MKIITTSINKPPKIEIFGRPGIGKSRFAASFPTPFFIRTEDRHGHLHVKTHEHVLTSYDELLDILEWLATAEHSFKTVVLDTADSGEKLVHKFVCQQACVDDINHPKAFPFYLGYLKSAQVWDREILSRFTKLNEERKIFPVILSHVNIKHEPHPQFGEYQKFVPGTDKRLSQFIYKWADIVGFMDWRTVIASSEEQRLSSTNERLLKLKPKIYWETKESYNLPDEISIPEDKSGQYNGYAVLQAAIKAGVEKQEQVAVGAAKGNLVEAKEEREVNKQTTVIVGE